uniref:Uncharacterized protein n=1 Tax=Panagrolaimus sp. ES5 TaxID=591445 RepID=A0AC34F7B3_9BILA
MTAKVCFDEKNEEEYLEIENLKHICEKRKYNKEKYQKPYNFLLKPNFEIRRKAGNAEKQYLIILDSTDAKKCYKYINLYGNVFSCYSCYTKRKNVTAKLYKNNENEEYIVLSNVEHVCKSIPYYPPENDIKEEKVLYPPAFEYMENSSTGVPKIFIFTSANKKMCYVFHRVYGKENRYICSGCHDKPTKENTIFEAGKKIKGVVYIYLFKDSDGKYSVKLPSHQHICEPKKYQPKKYETLKRPKRKPAPIDESKKIKKPNFELQQNLKGDPKGKLIIFDFNDKSLCYEYCFWDNFYYCGRCRSKSVHVTAKLYSSLSEDGEEEEYIVLGTSNKHVCHPIKYEPEKGEIFDASNFMVFFQNDASKLTKIILFTSPSKEYCYEFTWHETAKHFYCYPCKCSAIKKHITGKLIKNDDGTEYFRISTKNEHSCTPKKFDLEKYQPKTIPESRFELGSNLRGKPNSKLYLFTSEKKEFFYEYYSTRPNHFICLQCIMIDKSLYVKAKMEENEKGEKFLALDSKEHICEPQKYEPEKNRCDNFQLLHNKFGIPKNQLIIFDENDKNFGYEFTLFKGAKSYSCKGCITEKKKHISVKLCSDKKGKEFIKIGEIEHVCTKRNFKKTGKIIGCKDFELKTDDENGSQIIVTNHPTDKKLGYKFIFDSELGSFYCQKCKEKDQQRCITATVCTDKNEIQFLLLNDKHICVPSLKDKVFG